MATIRKQVPGRYNELDLSILEFWEKEHAAKHRHNSQLDWYLAYAKEHRDPVWLLAGYGASEALEMISYRLFQERLRGLRLVKRQDGEDVTMPEYARGISPMRVLQNEHRLSEDDRDRIREQMVLLYQNAAGNMRHLELLQSILVLDGQGLGVSQLDDGTFVVEPSFQPDDDDTEVKDD